MQVQVVSDAKSPFVRPSVLPLTDTFILYKGVVYVLPSNSQINPNDMKFFQIVLIHKKTFFYRKGIPMD